MRTKIIQSNCGTKTRFCPFNKFARVGSNACVMKCEHYRESNHKFIWCKPPLGLRVMNFLSGFNTDNFKGKVLIFVFGICFGGLFMAAFCGIFK
jgi:hypothetical protein